MGKQSTKKPLTQSFHFKSEDVNHCFYTRHLSYSNSAFVGWMVGYLSYDVSISSLLYDDGEAERCTCCITDCAQQQRTSKEESTRVQNSHYLLPACVSKEEVWRKSLDHDLQTKPKQFPWTGCRLIIHEDAAERQAQKRQEWGVKECFYIHTRRSVYQAYASERPSATFQVWIRVNNS